MKRLLILALLLTLAGCRQPPAPSKFVTITGTVAAVVVMHAEGFNAHGLAIKTKDGVVNVIVLDDDTCLSKKTIAYLNIGHRLEDLGGRRVRVSGYQHQTYVVAFVLAELDPSRTTKE
jgi:hypothetical protein